MHHSESLKNCKHIPGWVKPFLVAIKNGYSETNAANRVGISTLVVKRRVDIDPAFKENYEKNLATRAPRYGHGRW